MFLHTERQRWHRCRSISSWGAGSLSRPPPAPAASCRGRPSSLKDEEVTTPLYTATLILRPRHHPAPPTVRRSPAPVGPRTIAASALGREMGRGSIQGRGERGFLSRSLLYCHLTSVEIRSRWEIGKMESSWGKVRRKTHLHPLCANFFAMLPSSGRSEARLCHCSCASSWGWGCRRACRGSRTSCWGSDSPRPRSSPWRGCTRRGWWSRSWCRWSPSCWTRSGSRQPWWTWWRRPTFAPSATSSSFCTQVCPRKECHQ